MRLVEVVKTYTQGGALVHALASVSLTVAPGEFVAVTGPSGSGKSTLLHMIGGLDRPDGGEVWVDGEWLAAMDDDAVTLLRRRKIGFIFRQPAADAQRRENVAPPAPRRRVATRRGGTCRQHAGTRRAPSSPATPTARAFRR